MNKLFKKTRFFVGKCTSKFTDEKFYIVKRKENINTSLKTLVEIAVRHRGMSEKNFSVLDKIW